MESALGDINWSTLLEAASKALESGHYDDAEKLLQRSLVELEQRLEEDSKADENSETLDPHLSEILTLLGDLYAAQGWHSGAHKYYLRALSLFDESTKPSERASTLTKLAIVQRAQGKYQEVEPYFKQALDIYTKAPGKYQHEIINMDFPSFHGH
jgi:tetratricopeptide (TPR) repeat protein